MKTNNTFYFFLLLISSRLLAQTPYTQNQFAYDSLINVVYGSAVNYAGNSETLLLDIYKPVGDSNCLRPIMIMVHGGAWIAGSKADYNMVYMSRQLAKKGWVVANINYRLGTHKAANYTMYALCNTSLSAPCGYISDSAEIYRANFRAMQDAKGVIRFMKNRNNIDSTDINNVFIAGESAGGFVSFAAAFTDKISEKHPACFAIANAPTPDADMATYGCIPSPNNLSRPDLGSIDGTLHLGTYNARVKGIGNFYGGALDLNIFSQTIDTPLVYMFHQGSDVVVHYNKGKLLGRTSWECYSQTNICQSYHYYPTAWGSEGVRQHFITLGTAAPAYQAEIINNYNYLNNCFSNGHSVDNSQLRLQNMVNLFAPKIAASGNNPQTNCLTIGMVEKEDFSKIHVFPNPASSQITIHSTKILNFTPFFISDSQGRIVFQDTFSSLQNTININQLERGVYFLQINGIVNKPIKLIKQ